MRCYSLSASLCSQSALTFSALMNPSIISLTTSQCRPSQPPASTHPRFLQTQISTSVKPRRSPIPRFAAAKPAQMSATLISWIIIAPIQTALARTSRDSSANQLAGSAWMAPMVAGRGSVREMPCVGKKIPQRRPGRPSEVTSRLLLGRRRFWGRRVRVLRHLLWRRVCRFHFRQVFLVMGRCGQLGLELAVQ